MKLMVEILELPLGFLMFLRVFVMSVVVVIKVIVVLVITALMAKMMSDFFEFSYTCIKLFIIWDISEENLAPLSFTRCKLFL